MTQEEKAKAYDEALKVLHKYDGANIMFSQSLKEEMFPELYDNEDEKIRDEIIIYIGAKNDISLNTHNRWLSWLEKKGEQKSTEWSKEDIEMLNSAISFVEHSAFTTIGKGKKNVIAWLKSLKNRINNF